MLQIEEDFVFEVVHLDCLNLLCGELHVLHAELLLVDGVGNVNITLAVLYSGYVSVDRFEPVELTK